MDSSSLCNFFVFGEVGNIFDKESIAEHFQNLCAKVGVECTEQVARAQAATQTRDWDVAWSEWRCWGDVIWLSKDVIDRHDWFWLFACLALLLANLSAFPFTDFKFALKSSVVAVRVLDGLQYVEEVDLKSYVEPTLWRAMYLWASTSDCEEEALDLDVKEFLIQTIGYPRDVSKLKLQCKEFVIKKSESVIWEVQKYLFHCGKIAVCLEWVEKGNDLYNEKYPGKLDYVSKFNEAYIWIMFGHYVEAMLVLEEIEDNIKSKPWEENGSNVHPATLYCTLEYAFWIHQLLCMCYEMLLLKPGESTQYMSENVNKERDECISLWGQMQSDGILLPSRKSLAEAWEHATNKRWKEVEACFETSRGQSIYGQFVTHAFLDKLLISCQIKYRQSYESGSPDESHFSSAELWGEKLLESNFYSLCPLLQWQARNIMKLVRLHHEKDRQVMFLNQSSNQVNGRQREPILEYGRRAVECYVKALVEYTGIDDIWLVLQDVYRNLYYMLQFHNFALWIESHTCTLSDFSIEFADRLQQLWNQTLMLEGVSMESALSQEIWKQSLMWAERRVGKNIFFQLAPNMLSSSTMQQLREFDLNDDVAWSTLKSSRAACGPGTVLLEYFVSELNDLQYVYVMTKEDMVFMQILKISGLDATLWDILEWMRTMFYMFSRGSRKYNLPHINACLEWMYELLISPVANFLADMEQEDKLIIVAPEILSDVPFAALRKPNSSKGEGYLIQSHTVSVTPSLRVLQHCDQRLKELDRTVLHDTKPGTIVAVGDPAYEERLEESGEEVNFIEKLFGEENVKKLVGPEATPSEVLKWAKYPSENRVKQVIIHIAAHGIGKDDDQDVQQGAIVLASPASSCQENCGPEARPLAQDNGNFDRDNARNETELGDAVVDVKEAQMSSHGEVGGIRTGVVVSISEDAPHILKSENISGCGFQWKAHMVVLSACDTARGAITLEGVLNLPRALMIAGVPCVVVSQWKVGDKSTCKLMKRFYQELKSGKDVSSSLRVAMLTMIKDGDRVHEWAPFFVCGLPTVCLPKELQAATTCKGHDSGTSSHTKAELRLVGKVKDVKVKPLDLADRPVTRLFKRQRSNPDKCDICLENLEKASGRLMKMMKETSGSVTK